MPEQTAVKSPGHADAEARQESGGAPKVVGKTGGARESVAREMVLGETLRVAACRSRQQSVAHDSLAALLAACAGLPASRRRHALVRLLGMRRAADAEHASTLHAGAMRRPDRRCMPEPCADRMAAAHHGPPAHACPPPARPQPSWRRWPRAPLPAPPSRLSLLHLLSAPGAHPSRAAHHASKPVRPPQPAPMPLPVPAPGWGMSLARLLVPSLPAGHPLAALDLAPTRVAYPFYFPHRASLVPGLSDRYLSLVMPVASYWYMALGYLFLDWARIPFFERYRIRDPNEGSVRNRVSLPVVAKAVLLQQCVQTIVGCIFVEPDSTGIEQVFRDHASCIRAVGHIETSIVARVLGVRLGSLFLHYFGSSIAQLVYWWVVPTLHLLYAL